MLQEKHSKDKTPVLGSSTPVLGVKLKRVAGRCGLAGRLAGWLAGWPSGRLGRLAGWLAGRLASWLAGGLAGWLAGWLDGCRPAGRPSIYKLSDGNKNLSVVSNLRTFSAWSPYQFFVRK